MSSELRYFQLKLQDIDKQLGGNHNASKAQQGKSKDAFKNGEFKVLETIRYIQKAQDERDNQSKTRTNFDTIKKSTDIRGKIYELRGLIGELDKILMKQRVNKKFKPEDISGKDKRLSNYKTHAKIFDNRENGDIGTMLDEPEPLTLEQLKLDIDRTANTDYRARDEELNEEEIGALSGFGRKDQEIDKVAGEINEALEGLHHKVINMNEGIAKTNQQVNENIREVDKAMTSLVLTNKKLKELVKKYRAPSKFCLDMVCVLILLGLAAVLYNMIKNK